MAQWHLDELRMALERRGWRLALEPPGNDYKISGTWALERAGQPNQLIIDFDGLDDMKTLPLAENSACSIRGTSTSLHFRRRGERNSGARERWSRDLALFVAGVEDHAP